MRKGRLIVFSGVDGAGKSTQIALLGDALRRVGTEPRSFWARGGYTPTLEFLKRCLRRLRPGALPPPGPSAARDQKFGSSRVRRTWLRLAIWDLVFWYGIVLRLRVLFGKTVLCDRYLEDTCLDFRRNFPSEPFEQWWCWRVLRWCCPEPRCRFLLLVPPEESVRRSAQKNEPFPDSPETLQWRYDAYLQLAAQGGWVALDCTHPAAEVHRSIWGHLQP